MDSADCKHEITLFGKATSGKDEIPDGEDPADMKFTIFVVFKMSRFWGHNKSQLIYWAREDSFFWHQVWIYLDARLIYLKFFSYTIIPGALAIRVWGYQSWIVELPDEISQASRIISLPSRARSRPSLRACTHASKATRLATAPGAFPVP